MAKTVEMQPAVAGEKMNAAAQESVVLNRDELFKKAISEIQQDMQKDLAEWDALMQTKSMEELSALEQQLLEEFKKNDEYIKAVEYKLPEEVEFNKSKFKAADIHKSIVYFLNKLEVEWKATLGIYQAITFWKQVGDGVIPYAVFDSTLRLLGTLKFKGEKECMDILVVNNYMASAHESYIKDTTWLQYLSAKHNTILQAMQKLEKPAEVTAKE